VSRAAFLLALQQAKPARGDLIPLAIVALGVVVGFLLLTALALQHPGAVLVRPCGSASPMWRSSAC